LGVHGKIISNFGESTNPLAENSKQENYAFATGSTIQTRRENNWRKIPNRKITLFATGSTIQTHRENNWQKIPNRKITLLLLDLLSKPVGKIIGGKFQTGK
jgi:hypothetical protein